jgi:ribosomal protein S18 acetylase RimI-like enzyme
MMGVQVRSMRAGDVEACAHIVAGDPLWHRYGISMPRARRLLGGAVRSRLGLSRARAAGELAVAHHGADVLGFIWFRLEGTFHHSGYVRWIAVAPQARGRAVGARLMRHAEERIFRRGPNVYLLVSDFNVKAQAFYRKLGYVKVGALRDYVVPGITERVYRKTRGPIVSQRRREQ